ncbi:MAG TPA: M20/M25/M40 family metallo-hydrolase [Terriglobales bacterium]|nr:M20/M25/M40 family metallo-hydrolase [Terriglobales bacterium]
MDLEGDSAPHPVQVSNVVAQIKGSAQPDEQVIIGAHLDSWDLGEGAVDNGTGTVAVLEAGRLLKSFGRIPRRSLTFVLFYGEEQGEMGSRAFVKEHAAELDKIDAVLIDDPGAGRITGIPLEDLWSTGPLMEEIYQPLSRVFNLDPISNELLNGSDHDQFLLAGVPAYLAIQAPAHYGYAHHSTDDVFELVEPDALREQAAVLAAWMWNTSQMPTSFPHHKHRPGA